MRCAPMIRVWKEEKLSADPGLPQWWAQIDQWRAKNSLSFKNSTKVIKPQHAIDRLYALTRGRETYITTEVGQHQMWAMQRFKFEEPNHWMTSGGLGTMGYWLAGGGGRADGASRCAGDRHRRRSERADDHAGDVHGGAVRSADQDFYLEQRVYGHGAPVAAAAAWRALFAFLFEALPDFVKLADAYGAVGLRASTPDELDAKIRR
jgi:acetolactate synthase-1/2/3 large subunit